ncbi:hypothetical protein GGF50DRAFT_92852, partial [Schizophyllum commune]
TIAVLKTTTQFPDSRDAHDLVIHLAGGGNEVDKLADLAIGHMRVGKVVVIDGCPPSVPHEAGNPTGDIGFWEKTMRCNKVCRRDFQGKLIICMRAIGTDFLVDMRLLATGEKKLYESMSLDDFCSSIDDLGRIRCALDLKPGIRLFDPLVEKLAEGHQEIRSPSHSQKVRDYDWIPLAALQAEDWCLAHQNGFLTSSHADAFGLCTSIEVVGEGAKLWFVLAFEDPADEGITREELLRRGSLVVAHGEKDDGASNVLLMVKDGSFRIVGSCIVLRAGQKILQPPGQAHLVYTPIHCTTLGKQFLCYATLHLTEYARAVEFKTRGRGTNQDLHVLQYMLLQMAAALPARVAAGQEFRRKPLIALCLMVLEPRNYIPSTAPNNVSTEAATFLRRMLKPKRLDWVRGAVDMLAAEALTRVLLVLTKNTDNVSANYLTQSLPWRDPGPVVDNSLLRGLLDDLINPDATELQSMFDMRRTQVGTVPQGSKRKRI